jgi:uncharacterized protein YbjQ (UPF0145 family)
MRFFHHGSAEERAATAQEQERDARGQAMLEAGGLPLRAQERLTRRAEGARPALWTSDLSVGEYLAARTLRLEPLGQVLGASIYHSAYNVIQTASWSEGELSAYSQALYGARDRALERLRQEAALLGAHGVIGVRLEQQAYEWGAHLIDVVAMGTAVRLPGGPQLECPFLSDLSGQEALLLLQAGYVPVGVALGCCAYYVLTDWSDEQQMHSWIWGSWANSEMQHYTAATYQARHLAMRYMADDARRMGAQGIVGSDVHVHVHEIQARRQRPYSNEMEIFEDHIVEFIAVGTAIAEIGGGHQPVHASLALDISR